jgi:hypothetical protein
MLGILLTWAEKPESQAASYGRTRVPAQHAADGLQSPLPTEVLGRAVGLPGPRVAL